MEYHSPHPGLSFKDVMSGKTPVDVEKKRTPAETPEPAADPTQSPARIQEHTLDHIKVLPSIPISEVHRVDRDPDPASCHMTMPGNPQSAAALKRFPPMCTADTATAGVRCCAIVLSKDGSTHTPTSCSETTYAEAHKICAGLQMQLCPAPDLERTKGEHLQQQLLPNVSASYKMRFDRHLSARFWVWI